MVILTTREAAEAVRLSKAQLERLRLRGGGPDFLKIGRSVRYREHDIELWLQRHLTPTHHDEAQWPDQVDAEPQIHPVCECGGE